MHVQGVQRRDASGRVATSDAVVQVLQGAWNHVPVASDAHVPRVCPRTGWIRALSSVQVFHVPIDDTVPGWMRALSNDDSRTPMDARMAPCASRLCHSNVSARLKRPRVEGCESQRLQGGTKTILTGTRVFTPRGLMFRIALDHEKPATKAEYEVKCRLLLNIIVGERATVLELLPSEDKSLLIGGNTFLVLYLCLDVIYRITWFDFQSDCFSSERLYENLHGVCYLGWIIFFPRDPRANSHNVSASHHTSIPSSAVGARHSSGTLSSSDTVEKTVRRGFEIMRRSAPESPMM